MVLYVKLNHAEEFIVKLRGLSASNDGHNMDPGQKRLNLNKFAGIRHFLTNSIDNIRKVFNQIKKKQTSLI